VNLLIHSSLSDIWSLVMLLMMFLMMLFLREGGSLMGRCIRSIWNEWYGASFPGIERWKRVNNETMDLLVHSSLSYIGLFVLFVMMFSMMLLLRVIPSTQSTITIKWRRRSFLSINTRNLFMSEVKNFLIHTSFSHILSFSTMLVLMLRKGSGLLMMFLVMLLMMLLLIETSGVFIDEVMNFLIHIFISNELLLMMLLLGNGFWRSIIHSLPLWIWRHVLVGEFVYPWVIVLWRNWINLFLLL
jgi:hypothetical protein